MGIKTKLHDIRVWAQLKIDNRQEPPWAWYQYMKLIETIDAIQKGQSVTEPDPDEPQVPM